MNRDKTHLSPYVLLREGAFDRSITMLLVTAFVVILLLLPTWTAQYLPLYDYQNHLLEAQVVVHYEDPEFNYAAHYQIREDWWLRSNALSTLLMIGLGSMLSMQIAGKVVLSLYFIVFASGMALLLARLERPIYLLLTLPLLAYNFTYTMGLLNWSYGFALLPWAVLGYTHLHVNSSPSRLYPLIGLALVSLLIYMAHILAWGLLLLILFTLAVKDRFSLKRWAALVLVASSAVPMLLFTRPFLAALPLTLALGLWVAGKIFKHLNLRSWQVILLGLAGLFIFFFSYFWLRETIRSLFPDLGYSPYSKLGAIPQLFTLPYFSGADMRNLEFFNWAVLLVLIGLAALLISEHWRDPVPERDSQRSSNSWLTLVGLLVLAYFFIPTRTGDIITTEPRILLVTVWAGLLGTRLPPSGSRRRGVLLSVLVLLVLAFPLAAWLHALQYDRAAQRWTAHLSNIPPHQRLLVFSDPLPAPPELTALRIEQVFDQHQFSNTYALQQGGFVSTTFFNGPLLPNDSRAIPPYWWDEFHPGPYLEQYCNRLAPYYDYVVVWNPRSERLLTALDSCFGVAEQLEAEIGIWTIE